MINCDGSDVEQEWWTALEKLVTIEVAACITSLLGEVETDGETARLLARLLGVEAKNLPALQQVVCSTVAAILGLRETRCLS